MFINIIILVLTIFCIYVVLKYFNKNNDNEDKDVSEISHLTSDTKYATKQILPKMYFAPMPYESDDMKNYPDALSSIGPDNYLDDAHYEMSPGESRSEWHEKWRNRVRSETIFHPGSPNYC
jgi:hypothetical protein